MGVVDIILVIIVLYVLFLQYDPNEMALDGMKL